MAWTFGKLFRPSLKSYWILHELEKAVGGEESDWTLMTKIK